MVFRIKKGRHSAGWFTFPVFHPKRLCYKVSLDYGYDYSFPDEDQYDWNKLFGYSFGWNPHKNSVRFAWRWNRDKNGIDIASYVYEDGKLTYEDIVFIQRNDNIFTMTCHEGCVALSVNSKEVAFTKIVNRPSKARWGLFLKPYFGGNKKAPEEVKFNFEKI